MGTAQSSQSVQFELHTTPGLTDLMGGILREIGLADERYMKAKLRPLGSEGEHRTVGISKEIGLQETAPNG
jgi:hypothetical protein